MKIKMVSWLKLAAIVLSVSALTACVEIKSDAKIASDATVHFTTTYDLSKFLNAMKVMNQGNTEELVKNIGCEKMNEQLQSNYACKDLGPGKFSVSSDFKGEAANGVTLNSDKNQVSIDAVQLFKKVADLNPSQQPASGTDVASAMMQKGVVPVSLDQASQYKQIGVVLSLNVTLPAEVLTVDGVAAKDVKDKTIAVNFVDIAGKDSYIIIAKTNSGGIWKKILFVLFAIAVLLAAFLYLLKYKKKQQSKSIQPEVVVTVATVAASADKVETETANVIEKMDFEDENPEPKI